MMQTVQLAISDAAYLAALREALSHSCAWKVEPIDLPAASRSCVLAMDEQAFERIPLPLANPERVVLITRKDTHQLMAQAWEAGIVSVVHTDDPLDTVLLAIMAAALRVAKSHNAAAPSEISPNPDSVSASNGPIHIHAGPKHNKLQ
jgi:hypothetical protein